MLTISAIYLITSFKQQEVNLKQHEFCLFVFVSIDPPVWQPRVLPLSYRAGNSRLLWLFWTNWRWFRSWLRLFRSYLRKWTWSASKKLSQILPISHSAYRYSANRGMQPSCLKISTIYLISFINSYSIVYRDKRHAGKKKMIYLIQANVF